MSEQKKLTTASGIPYFEHENSMTAGPRGPILLQDFILHEKMAHFNRERIPERVVHAKGSGAYGTFTVTHDIAAFTKAKIFDTIGKQTRVFVRFSTVGGEKGSADSERDPRGFAVKFYTEEGNWDLVGNNTPIFFIKDPKKFSDFIHTQKRDPRTNTKSATMVWDFWSLNPESLHQVLILMSDRGTPISYRHMHGFGSHTFSFLNKDNERFYVKFHFITEQGIKNFTNEEAAEMRGKDPDQAQRDLVESIDKGDFPRWKLKVQIMPEADAKTYRWNPFDLTKVWPHADYPLIDVGVMELNENPDNYFAHVEQAAFAPAHVVDGIGYSPDKMLQGRLLSYPDAHRYRLGVNYEQIPVNRCPFAVNNYHRDGAMRVDGNGGSHPNYFPNSFGNIAPDPAYKEPGMPLDSLFADWYDRNADGENDHYTQPGNLFRLMTAEEKKKTISNIVGAMSGIEGHKREEIINRQLCHWFRADLQLGMGIAQGLGVSVDAMATH
ncbi:catalase [Chitinophaga pinensis]|uniref:catalase n=1 Tax=Chitinophaga pinensis (strain ATCC 43595 / DSM 2588 / LMG 13176 / NBRC 15968 / NCIMB 11800 / UQM 2034) TaxID=485918 RepID=A0A979G9T6_CHIPD|nr:catalase [Chitinophaga pinensis]ACU63263.1 Catalase [Chitinophaga pinensis DSM 2588]